MPRILGIDIPGKQKIPYALRYIYGVGPKLAQSILSGITVEEFERAVQHNQSAVLNRIPGVGKKTAERLILELQDKIKTDSAAESRAAAGRTLPKAGEEAILALVSLGYKRGDAERAVQKALSDDSALEVEALLRAVLSEMR